MIRALLVDDEKPARERLRRMLESVNDFQVVGEATNGLEALEKIESLKPDVAFLDIEMPELDGLGVARAIGREGPAVVFVTAYDEFALKAFETYAVDYLVKPVTLARLEAAIEKVRGRAFSARDRDISLLLNELARNSAVTRLAVKSGNRYIVVDLARVSAILAKDHYSAIQVEGRELLADDPLDVQEKRLDPSQFVRVHRGAIVNISFIRELEREGDRKFTAILSDAAKTRVAIARERLDEVKKRLGLP